MFHFNHQQSWAILMSAALTLSATPPSIGSATSPADFELNQRTVASSGTLHEGSSLATRNAASTLRLQNGARVDLAPASRSQVFADRLLLEQGALDLHSQKNYRVETRDFQILPDSPSARASVSLAADQTVSVAARQGSFRVANRQGVLLARVSPGRSLLFSPAPAPSSEMLLYGKLEKVEGDYFLTDQTSGVRAQIKGSDLDKHVGKKICVKGEAEAGARGITMLQATSINSSCSAATAAAAGSSSISKAAIVAGVSIGAAAAATTLAVTLNSTSAVSSSGGGLGPQTISQ